MTSDHPVGSKAYEGFSYDGFNGEVGRIMSTSTPAWTRPPTAPDGAPNVLVVLVDDLGFSDVGCFGSEIDTPHVDRLADEGLRYVNFHVNPMCSPTRCFGCARSPCTARPTRGRPTLDSSWS